MADLKSVPGIPERTSEQARELAEAKEIEIGKMLKDPERRIRFAIHMASIGEEGATLALIELVKDGIEARKSKKS